MALLCRVAQFLAGQGLGCGVLTEEQSAEEAGRTSAAFAGGELQVCGDCGGWLCPCLVAFDKLALIVSRCAEPCALTPTIDTNSTPQVLVCSEAVQALEGLKNTKVGVALQLPPSSSHCL